MTSQYDIGGRRTQLAWPDGFYVNYDYDVLGEMLDARENGSLTLASFSYDNLGRRAGVTRYNGVSTSYGFDVNSDLTSLSHQTSSTTLQSFTYAYNPAGQIVNRTASVDSFAWPAPAAYSQSYGVNSQNQYTSVGATAYGYDSRGNLGSGPRAYTFDSQNRLATASGSPSASLSYDPTNRLFQTAASSSTQFLYDGDQIVAEYASGAVLRRYVDGPTEDEPIVWYEGANGTSDRRWLLEDERGSVIAGTNPSASILFTNSYDEYGQPGSANTGRFQYTGQAYIPEAGLYDYKARVYLSAIGRFGQTDPTGYQAGINLYGYVSNEPVNQTDYDGMGWDPWATGENCYTSPGSDLVGPNCNPPNPCPPPFCSGFGVPGFGYPTSGGSASGPPPGFGALGGGATAVSGKPQNNQKPAYCSSLGYKIGDFASGLGGAAQNAGVGTAVVGGVVVGVSWWTGAGDIGGGALIAGGGSLYSWGTAATEVGNGIKFLSGQSAGVTAATALSIPLMRLGPVSRMVADKSLSYAIDKTGLGDPCH